MSTLLEDLRYAARLFRRSPGLTLTAVFTLALGIAASSTVFGWIDRILLHPIPGVARSHELATLETVAPGGELQNTSYRDYRDYRDNLRQVSGLAVSLLNVFTTGGEDNPRLLWGEFVSANYFSVMGVSAIRGRTFLPGESADSPGGSPVVVISDRLWQSEFQRDPLVIGKTLRVNQRELTVVGVVAPEFRGAVPGLLLEMWMPVSLAPELNGQGPWLLNNRGARLMWLTARLRPGVTIDQARAEAAAAARRIAEAHPDTNRDVSATVLPVAQGHVGAQQLLRTPLRVLMAVCLVLFLIVAVNVTNLQVARAAERQKEFSIRLALGVRPARLVRQLLTESLLLAAMGAAGGVLLSVWCGQALGWLLPPVGVPFDSTTNWRMLPFAIVLCVAAALLTGAAPAMHSLRASLMANLKDSSRGSTAGPAAGRMRSLLVVSEVALATVALVGTGVFVRSFSHARTLQTGMDVGNVACVKYYVETFCRSGPERLQFFRRLRQRLHAVPGVEAVSYANYIPLEFGDGPDSEVSVDGYVPAPGEFVRALRSSVSPDYFTVLRIPLLEGRDFREQDGPDAAPVAVVNQAFQRRYFGAGPAVGRTVRAAGRTFTVIGLVRDSKYRRLTEAPAPYLYSASSQMSGGEFWMAFFVRTNQPVDTLTAALRRQAAEVNPATGGSNFVPYQDWVGAALYPERVTATLVGVVGAICLVLSAIGLYSVLTFAVKQRTHEFGIRIALGGQPGQVLAIMLRRGMSLTLVGLGAGTLLALASLKVAAAFLPKLTIGDSLVFATSAALLSLVALLASYLPARRATRVDPMVALRHD